MKKLLCFVLTLAMVLSMVPSVFASEIPSDVQYFSVFTGEEPGVMASRYSGTSVAGSAGKDASDKVIRWNNYGSNINLANMSVTVQNKINVTSAATDEKPFACQVDWKYYVLEFDFKPESNTGFDILGPSNRGAAESIKYNNANLRQGEWNRVAVVFDFSQIDTEWIADNYQTLVDESKPIDNGDGTVKQSPKYEFKESEFAMANLEKFVAASYMYINGVFVPATAGAKAGNGYYATRLRDRVGQNSVCWHPTSKPTSDTPNNNLNGYDVRFTFTGGKTAEIDNAKAYQTNIAPNGLALSSLPVLAAGAGYTVDGGSIKASSAISLTDVKAANAAYDVAAYADNTFAKKLSASAVLVPGNIVIAKDRATSTLSRVYTVENVAAADGRKLLYTNDGNARWSRNGANLASAGGPKYYADAQGGNYYGKDATDATFNLYFPPTAYSDSGVYFYAGAANQPTLAADGSHPYNYYVFEMEFRGNNAQDASIAFRGPNDSILSDTLDYRVYFPNNEWSKIAVIADFSNVDTSYKAAELLEESKTLGAAGQYQKMGSTIADFDITKAAPAIKTYVNGELACVKYADRLQDRFGMYNTYYEGTTLKSNVSGADFRLVHMEGMYSIYDNALCYLTNVAPDGVALTKLPEVEDQLLVAKGLSAYKGTATVTTYGAAPLTADYIEEKSGYDIVAYTDKTLKDKIGGNVVLTADNYILAKDKFTGTAKVFKVAPATQTDTSYTLFDTVTIVNKEPGETGSGKAGRFTLANNIKATAVTGVGGKADSDVSFKFEKNTTGNPYIGNGALASVDANGNVTNSYYVLKFNFMPTAASTSFSFSGPNGGTVCNGIATRYFKTNEWNSVLIYVDYTNIDPSYLAEELLAENKALAEAGQRQVLGSTIDDFDVTKSAPAGYVFVNGVRIGGAAYPDRLQDFFGVPTQYYHPSTKKLSNNTGLDFRLALTGSAANPEAYIDDLYIYQTETCPDGYALTTLPEITAAGANATAVDDRLTIKGDVTVTDLVTDAYSVVSSGEEGAIVSGGKVTLLAENNAINAYKVSGFNADAAGATATDVEAGNWIIVAEYDAAGNMVACEMEIAAEAGDISVAFTPSGAEGNYVHAYLLDGTSTITPFSTPIVIQ